MGRKDNGGAALAGTTGVTLLAAVLTAIGLQAHRAHYPSAALQTELLRLTHWLQNSQAKLAVINEQLAHRRVEVQARQKALRQQTTIDVLTGLYNRRHLNEVTARSL